MVLAIVHQVAEIGCCLAALDGRTPHFLDDVLMQGQRFRRRRHHGDTNSYVRLFSEAKWADRKSISRASPEDLKSVLRQTIGHEPDLNADRLFLDHRGEMFYFRARHFAADRFLVLSETDPPNEPVIQKWLDLHGRNEVHDRRPPATIGSFALVQNFHDFVDVSQRTAAVWQIIGDAFLKDLFQGHFEAVGAQKERNRTGEHDDVLGRFLELADAFEVADRRWNVFY